MANKNIDGTGANEEYECDGIKFPDVYSDKEIEAMYKELGLPDETVALLHSYFGAFANLYGIIPLSKALEIYNKQNQPLTEEEFIAFADIVRHETQNYCILGQDEIYSNGEICEPLEREIIDDSILLFDDCDDYEEMKAQHEGKPYYIPSKRTLLQYADGSYIDQTREYCALKDFMKYQMKIKNSESVAEDLQLCASVGDDADMVMEELKRRNFREFASREQAKEFFRLYFNMANNTRRQANRGFTPMELAKRSGIMPQDDSL